jgi:uncharacterized protein (TIGR03435 family)
MRLNARTRTADRKPGVAITTPANAPPPTAPDLFQALQQQLGLQLVAKKLPFDVVVIDSIDKMPTAN